MPLVEHLRELRRRLTRAILAVLVCTVVAFFYYTELFRFVTAPFEVIQDDYRSRGANVTLNFRGVGDPFTYALKICAMAGIFAASPVWMYQLWGFVAPGLHRRERRWGIAFVVVSVPLFLTGAALAYRFLPKGFDLLIGFNPDPQRVANIIGLDDYLSFVLRTLLVFGLSFVMPVFLIALNLVGVVTGRALVRAWRFVILGTFVFAAVATPSGDPWTMSALAFPMLGLFYASVVVCLIIDRRRRLSSPDTDYSQLDDDEASPLDLAPVPGDDLPVAVDDDRSRHDDLP